MVVVVIVMLKMQAKPAVVSISPGMAGFLSQFDVVCISKGKTVHMMRVHNT